MKDYIKYGDRLLTTLGTPEIICGIINEYKYDGNSEILTFGLPEGVKLARFDSKVLGLADFSIFGEYIGCKEGVWLGEYDWSSEGIT